MAVLGQTKKYTVETSDVVAILKSGEEEERLGEM